MAEQQFSVDDARQVIENGIAQAQEILSDPAKINELLKELEVKVKELPASMGDALANVPLMAQMVKGYVTKEYTEVSPKVIATMVSSILYLVSKNDIIPDNVPMLGFADDIAVFALALKVNQEELKAFADWRDSNAGATEAEVVEVQKVDEQPRKQKNSSYAPPPLPAGRLAL